MTQPTVAARTTHAMEKAGIIGGERVSGGDRLEVRSPYDGSLVGVTWNATPEQAEHAIHETVRGAAVMREISTAQRVKILQAISARIDARKEELARVLALEAGKPIKAARLEVERAAFTFAVAASEATHIEGEVLPLDLMESTAGRFGIVRRFPVGPVLAITPFNFPSNLVAHKAAPAIAAGCSLLLKPAPQAPFSALLLNEIALEAGLPPGAWNTLPCSNDTAEKLVSAERLRMLTFTGSAAVGWALKSKAGKKRVALELGGNAGCIIHRDADLDYAAERCVFGGFSYAGQSCISVQRIRVHREVNDKFLERLVPRVQKLKCGDPMDDATDVGPLIRPSDAARVEQWIAEAKAAGATVLTGGTRTGSVVEPAVLTGTTPAMKVNCQEIFGPVVTVEAYDDVDAAIAEINDSPYGLQAGLFTRDVKLIFDAYRRLEVGGVIVGDVPTFRIDGYPYGLRRGRVSVPYLWWEPTRFAARCPLLFGHCGGVGVHGVLGQQLRGAALRPAADEVHGLHLAGVDVAPPALLKLGIAGLLHVGWRGWWVAEQVEGADEVVGFEAGEVPGLEKLAPHALGFGVLAYGGGGLLLQIADDAAHGAEHGGLAALRAAEGHANQLGEFAGDGLRGVLRGLGQIQRGVSGGALRAGCSGFHACAGHHGGVAPALGASPPSSFGPWTDSPHDGSVHRCDCYKGLWFVQLLVTQDVVVLSTPPPARRWTPRRKREPLLRFRPCAVV